MSTQKQFLERVLPRMAIAPNDRILDLGCGDGRACRAMAALTSEGMVVGIDSSGDSIREARKLSSKFDNILYIQAEAEENPWQDNFFSHVVMLDALSEVRDREATLRHVHRVMSTGGRLWVVERGERQAEALLEELTRHGFVDAHTGPVAAPDAGNNSQLVDARKP